MKIDILPSNEEKLLKAAQSLRTSPTEVINMIIEHAEFDFSFQIEPIKISFKKIVTQQKPKKIIKEKGSNFVTKF
jgi:hypothetical protein